MAGANATTKATVLLRIGKLLEARIPDFANRIFVVVEDKIPETVQSNEVLTVQITGGNFDYGAMVGGGSNVVHYQGTVRVGVWSTSRTDRPGVAVGMLTSSGRGLLRLQTKILKALTGSYLQEAECGGDGYTPNLIECMKPASDSQPQSAGKGGAGSEQATLAVDFSIDFKWDLDGDVDGEPG